jgi:hypothetical protein
MPIPPPSPSLPEIYHFAGKPVLFQTLISFSNIRALSCKSILSDPQASILPGAPVVVGFRVAKFAP